jgi:hypothetical protein
VRTVVCVLALCAGSGFAHQSTDDEVKAAMGRAARAAYLVKLAQVCGLPSSEAQYTQVKRAAILHAIERTDNDAKLTEEQARYIIERASDDGEMAENVARAKDRAENGECNNPQLAEAWASMVTQTDNAEIIARRRQQHHHPK